MLSNVKLVLDENGIQNFVNRFRYFAAGLSMPLLTNLPVAVPNSLRRFPLYGYLSTVSCIELLLFFPLPSLFVLLETEPSSSKTPTFVGFMASLNFIGSDRDVFPGIP